MGSLEERLSNSLHGGARVRGNTALDILTGRTPDYRFEPAPLTDHSSVAVSSQSTMIYLRERPAPENPTQRFRIARPAPPQRSRVSPKLRRYAVLAALVLGGLVAWRSWQHDSSLVGPVVARAADPVAMPAALPSAELTPAPIAELPLAAPEAVPNLPLATVPVPASELRLLMDQRFAPSTPLWPADPDATIWRGDGAYRLRASRPAHFVAVSIAGTDNIGDTIVTASFHKTGGPAGGGYGLIVRDQGPAPRDGENQLGHFYVFEAGDKGQFGVWLRDDDHWVDMLTWTPTDAVHIGTASNELTVAAIGDQISFLINGIPVASQVDTVLHTGAIGIFTGGDGNEVALEHIAVRVPH